MLSLKVNSNLLHKDIERQKRGQVSDEEIEEFSEEPVEVILKLLNRSETQKQLEEIDEQNSHTWTNRYF